MSDVYEIAPTTRRKMMGRHDGEEYASVPACKPDRHQFGMNGICRLCRWDRDTLIAQARRTLEVLAPI